MAELKAEEEPIFKGALKLVPALFQGGGFRPASAAGGDRPKELAVFKQFVVGLLHRGLNVLGEHLLAK